MMLGICMVPAVLLDSCQVKEQSILVSAVPCQLEALEVVSF